MQNPRAGASWVALSPRARLQSPRTTPTPTPPEGHARAQQTLTRGGFYLGSPSWLLLSTPEPLVTFSLQQLSSQQQPGQGEDLEEPLHPVWILPVLPRRVAPLLRCLTQSHGDETQAPQPRRWPAPWGAAGGGHPARGGLLGRGLCAPWWGPSPTHCCLGCLGFIRLRVWVGAGAVG